MTMKFRMQWYDTLADAINANLASYDDQVLDSNIAHAASADTRLKKFVESDEARLMLKDGRAQEREEKLTALAGGKKWFDIISSTRGDMEQRHDRIVEKWRNAIAGRNDRITRKLRKASVGEVVEARATLEPEGIFGHFVANTGKGEKTVLFNAALINAQIFHIRTKLVIK